jgi:hypothetical protein
MGMAQQMKSFSEEILNSYKNRLKGNEELVKEVQKTMDGFRKDQMEMAATLNANAIALRENMAKKQKERLISFDAMISRVREDVKGIQISTSDFLKAFTVSHHEMAGELRDMFAQDQADRSNWNTDRKILNADRLKNFEIQMKGIQADGMHIFNDTHDLLKKFDKEHLDMTTEMRNELHTNLIERVAYTKAMLLKFQQRLSEINHENQEMAKALRKDLSQNDAKRLKDFNDMFTGINVNLTDIQKRVREIQKYATKFLNEFSTDRKQGAATWAKMTESIAAMRKSFGTVPIPAKRVAKKEEAPIEADAVKDIIVDKEVISAEVVPEVAGSQKVLNLEEKVLDYISKHKNGVRVSDMEGPFGETRMRIGFISKKLLDEGKVRKIENSYFPIT